MYYGPINRTSLANIVIACDALICILFAINTCWLARSVSVEQYEVDHQFVQMNDFSVRVKNLPSKGSGAFEDLDQLKAQLLLHL